MSSLQYDSITAHPLCGKNTIKVVVDDTGYTAEANKVKAIVQNKNSYALLNEQYHQQVIYAPGEIAEILSTNPLSFTTSGFEEFNNLESYDGLVITTAGKSRGIIKGYENYSYEIEDPGIFSFGENFYIIGGYNNESSEYLNSVWHSTNGLSWRLLALPAWDARIDPVCVSDGTYLYILGGQDGSGFIGDIWRAAINTTTGVLTWDAAAIATGITELEQLVRGTYHPSGNVYTGQDIIDLSDGTATSLAWIADAEDTLIHYDANKNLLWSTVSGVRYEQVITSDGTVVDADVATFGYVHIQSEASDTWTIPHNLNNLYVAPYVLDSNDEPVIPATTTWSNENQIVLTFNESISGKCHAINGVTASGTTWNLTDNFANGNNGFFAVDTTGAWLEALSLTNNSLTFDEDTVGVFCGWLHGAPDVPWGRKCETLIAAPAATNLMPAYQGTSNPFFLVRSGGVGRELIVPSSFDYTDNINAKMYFTGDIETPYIRWHSIAMRQDDCQDLVDPFTGSYLSFGTNADEDFSKCVVTESGLWYSPSGGNQWEVPTATNLVVSGLAYKPSVNINQSILAIDGTDYTRYRSTDEGETFAETSSAGKQTVTFYGDLLIDDVAIGDKLYVYERPSDVIWESDEGDLNGGVYDDYTTHYILPNRVVPDEYTQNTFSLNLDSSWDRSFQANELTGAFVYLYLGSSIVEKKKIFTSSVTSVGGILSLYTETFDTIITASHSIQLIHNRPEGIYYYSVITKHASYLYTILHENNGEAFNVNQETTYEWYADNKYQHRLPTEIEEQNAENKNRMDLLLCELNRNRVMNNIRFNDPLTLPPEYLYRLGDELGVNLRDGSLNLETSRQLVAAIYEKVWKLGPCLAAIENLADLVLGSGHLITFSMVTPTTGQATGNILEIDFSAYGDYNVLWNSATQTRGYDATAGTWFYTTALADIPATLRTLIHRSLFIVNQELITDPQLIIDHTYDSGSGNVTINFEQPDILFYTLTDDTDRLIIVDDIKKRRLLKFLQILRDLIPFWVSIHYV